MVAELSSSVETDNNEVSVRPSLVRRRVWEWELNVVNGSFQKNNAMIYDVDVIADCRLQNLERKAEEMAK